MSNTENLFKSSLYFLIVLITNVIHYTNSFIEYSGVPSVLVKLLAVAFLVDTVTGILSKRKLKKQDSSIKISSTIGIRGLFYKMFILFIILGVANFMQLVKMESDWLVVSVISLLTVFESYSILGNIYSIRTGTKKDEYDTISLLIKALMKRTKKVMKNLLNTIAGEDIVGDKLDNDEL
jgi:phage-related holin